MNNYNNNAFNLLAQFRDFAKQYQNKDARAEVMKLVSQNKINSTQLTQLMQLAQDMCGLFNLGNKK